MRLKTERRLKHAMAQLEKATGERLTVIRVTTYDRSLEAQQGFAIVNAENLASLRPIAKAATLSAVLEKACKERNIDPDPPKPTREEQAAQERREMLDRAAGESVG